MLVWQACQLCDTGIRRNNTYIVLIQPAVEGGVIHDISGLLVRCHQQQHPAIAWRLRMQKKLMHLTMTKCFGFVYSTHDRNQPQTERNKDITVTVPLIMLAEQLWSWVDDDGILKP